MADPHAREQELHPGTRPEPVPEARAASPLARLAALHDETAETARLANLLGRTPWLAAALAAAAAVNFALVAQAGVTAPPLVWLGFMFAAALVLWRLYRHALRSPFERLALLAFVADLKAALLFAGAAWGAGIFLAGPQDNPLAIMIYSVGMTIVAELLLRAPNAVLYFAVPAIVLAAVALALGPLGPAAACLLVAAGASVVALADIAAKLLGRRTRPASVTVS